MDSLLKAQISQLEEGHFHVLYWTAIAEDRGKKYNITNVFDDLKYSNITRTKQNVIDYINTLKALCFVEIREEKNRKNLYISTYGAKALQQLVTQKKIKNLKSNYLEEK